jgi:hypothetical protein
MKSNKSDREINKFGGIRTRVTPQNILPGDEFYMRGEPNATVYSVNPCEDGNTITVLKNNGEAFSRFYSEEKRVSIVEYPHTKARRRTLSRNGVLSSLANG